MIVKRIILFQLALAFVSVLHGQGPAYIVSRTSFSTDQYNEFAPVFYNGGLVFCTNVNTGITDYSNSQNIGFSKIYYTDTTANGQWRNPRLFSKKLKSKLNDGPATFNATRDTIFFTRNILVEDKVKDISPARNKLGLYSATLKGKSWTGINEFKYNNKYYNLGFNIITPAFSNDGKRLYFASDMPGGYGGSDLYYCQWNGRDWDEPVNLGPVINTSGNEGYPYFNAFGELIFSSDSLPGLGGKDIFLTKFADTAWLKPIGFDPPINSPYDDFGLVADSVMYQGYFSSNRNKTADIFHFCNSIPQIFHTQTQRKEQYCFTFNDNGLIEIDTSLVEYRWNFGDGEQAQGFVSDHCYREPGNYSVRLDAVDKSTGKVMFNKLILYLEIRHIEQAYISSDDYGPANDTIEFNGTNSYVPGYSILKYSWDFGDSTKATGDTVFHSFATPGIFTVKLEVILKSLSGKGYAKKASSKTISIFDYNNPTEAFNDYTDSIKLEQLNIRSSLNPNIRAVYSAEDDFLNGCGFAVEIFSSPVSTETGNPYFQNIPKNYPLRVIFNDKDSIYSYIVDSKRTLMGAYPSFTEMARLGYNNVRIKTYMPQNPAEKELFEIYKIYGTSTDLYFDKNERLSTSAVIILEKILRILKKYPSLRLEVAVHTDKQTRPTAQQAQYLTQQRAQTIVNYLLSRGINSTRMVAVGFGNTKPMASNLSDKGRKMNRRIEFNIIGE